MAMLITVISKGLVAMVQPAPPRLLRAPVNRNQQAPHSGKDKGCMSNGTAILPDRKSHLLGFRAERKVCRWTF